MKSTSLLRSISQTKRGLRPHLAYHAVTACVLPTLFYGADAWYPRQRGCAIPEWMVNKLNKALHQALRATVPVWKTFPIPALYREAGIPPVRIRLEQIRRRYAIRLGKIDERHPLAAVLREPIRGYSRLHGTAALAKPFPRPILLERRPTASTPTGGVDKKTAAQEFKA
jgi:hypothetical protein